MLLELISLSPQAPSSSYSWNWRDESGLRLESGRRDGWWAVLKGRIVGMLVAGRKWSRAVALLHVRGERGAWLVCAPHRTSGEAAESGSGAIEVVHRVSKIEACGCSCVRVVCVGWASVSGIRIANVLSVFQKVPVVKEEDEPEEEDEEEMGHAETYAEYMPIKCVSLGFVKTMKDLWVPLEFK